MIRPDQPQHHPHDDLLVSHSALAENPAVELVMSAHAALCNHCRNTISDLEGVGGVLLDGSCELPVSKEARRRTLDLARALAAPDPSPSSGCVATPDGDPADAAATVEYVLSLREAPEKASWSWRAPGVHEVRLPLAWNDIPVSVVRLRSGLHIPQHTHQGRELTLILAGSLTDSTATYRAGDLADYDSSVSHEQYVGSTEDCLCLVVNESRLVPQTLLGRAFFLISGS